METTETNPVHNRGGYVQLNNQRADKGSAKDSRNQKAVMFYDERGQAWGKKKEITFEGRTVTRREIPKLEEGRRWRDSNGVWHEGADQCVKTSKKAGLIGGRIHERDDYLSDKVVNYLKCYTPRIGDKFRVDGVDGVVDLDGVVWIGTRNVTRLCKRAPKEGPRPNNGLPKTGRVLVSTKGPMGLENGSVAAPKKAPTKARRVVEYDRKMPDGTVKKVKARVQVNALIGR